MRAPGLRFVRLLRFVRCARSKAGAGASSRQPSHFLLLRQKKVTKEKATPLRVSLRFAQTRAALIREKLRSSARAEGTWNPTRHGASLCGVQVGGSFRSSLTLTLAHTQTQTQTFVLVLVLVLAFECIRMPLFQPSRSEAVVGRAKQWPAPSPIPSARAEERSFSRIRAARV